MHDIMKGIISFMDMRRKYSVVEDEDKILRQQNAYGRIISLPMQKYKISQIKNMVGLH